MRRAFVFGNAVIDEVFRVNRLPQPGQSMLGTAWQTGLGGKGANQAIALCRTGIETRLVSAVGTDTQARAVRQALDDEPLRTSLFERSDLPTDRSVVFAQANGENAIVTTNDCAASLTLSECGAVLDEARPGDVVLLQGNLAREVTIALARRCSETGLPLVLNPSPYDDAFRALLLHAEMVFVNEAEAAAMTGLAGAEAVGALRAAGARQVVVTMGVRGALLGTGSDILHVAACPTEAVDGTGAGDCFEGVAVGSALLRGTDLDASALHHASLAAATAIARPGAAASFPDKAALQALLADTMVP